MITGRVRAPEINTRHGWLNTDKNYNLRDFTGQNCVARFLDTGLHKLPAHYSGFKTLGRGVPGRTGGNWGAFGQVRCREKPVIPFGKLF